jgi:RNA polymerase sigma-70 factor (ECF subfamily)
MLQSREEAEEVLQDTFLRLHRKIDTYDPELGSPRAFVYTIARNEALSRLRARTARPVSALEQDVHDPATVLAGSEPPDPLTHMEVDHALATLDPKDKKLLHLVFFQGYSHTEVAKLVGLWGYQRHQVYQQLVQEQRTVANWLARADVEARPVQNRERQRVGSVLLLPDGRALFVLREPPARGSAYQAWGHTENDLASLTVSERPVFEVQWAGYDSLYLSLEPPGGSVEPTVPLGRTNL